MSRGFLSVANQAADDYRSIGLSRHTLCLERGRIEEVYRQGFRVLALARLARYDDARTALAHLDRGFANRRPPNIRNDPALDDFLAEVRKAVPRQPIPRAQD